MSQYQDKSGSQVEVLSVEIVPQGGGLLRRVPWSEFQDHYTPVPAASDNRLVEVTAEWLPDGTKIKAYWNGCYWNGWVTPLFPLASVDQLSDLIPGIDYNDAENAVAILRETDIEKSYPLTITVDGKPVTVYVVGDGFCWELAT
ncbi:hypothetical protein ACU4GI_21630 [Cupriavidus basilensis]